MQAFYAQIADAYADRYFEDRADAPIVDELVNLLTAGASVLDVGCGPGTFTKYLHERGFLVEGIDLSPAMLAIARQKLPNCAFRQMDMRALDYESETFDAVNALYCLIHIPQHEVPVVLTEFRRVLKPGGRLLVIMQQGENDHIEDEPLQPGLQLFVNFTSAKQLSEELVDAGFVVRSLKTQTTNDEESLSTGIVWALAERP